MKTVGIMADRHNPLEPLLFGVFNLMGENWPTMMVTKQAARVAKGWKVADVERAADLAAEGLAEMVLPYARAAQRPGIAACSPIT